MMVPNVLYCWRLQGGSCTAHITNKMSRSTYPKTVSAMVNNDILHRVYTSPLKFWKETLDLPCCLHRERNGLCSVTCFAQISSLLVTLWLLVLVIYVRKILIKQWKFARVFEGESCVNLALLEVHLNMIQKTIILALATGKKLSSASLCKLVEKYDEILSSPGLLTTAIEYLGL